MQNKMKRNPLTHVLAVLLILLSLMFVVSVNAQHNPTPTNPWKWYTITKDTSFMGLPVNQFEVTIESYKEFYKCSKTDSIGNPIENYHGTTISMLIYFNRSARLCGCLDNNLGTISIDIEGLPFEFDPEAYGGVGVTNAVNEALSVKLNVPIENISE